MPALSTRHAVTLLAERRLDDVFARRPAARYAVTNLEQPRDRRVRQPRVAAGHRVRLPCHNFCLHQDLDEFSAQPAAAGQALAPETGDQVEVGVKLGLAQGLSGQLAFFEIHAKAAAQEAGWAAVRRNTEGTARPTVGRADAVSPGLAQLAGPLPNLALVLKRPLPTLRAVRLRRGSAFRARSHRDLQPHRPPRHACRLRRNARG